MEPVRHILARLVPHAGQRSVVLLGEGADHIAHEVDGELIVRQSKDPDLDRRTAATSRESAVLAAVAAHSTLPVPAVVATDPPVGVLVLRKVPGVPLLQHPLPSPGRLAEPLGSFLSRLHRAPTAKVADIAGHDAYPLSAYLGDATRDYEAITQGLRESERRLVEGFLGQRVPPEPATSVFCHNDLGSEHLLIDPNTGELTGVIDWADAAVTDPARDFALLYRDLGPPAFDRILTHYDLPWSDDDTERAVFLARCALLEDLAYGQRAGAAPYTAAALDHFGHTFGDVSR